MSLEQQSWLTPPFTSTHTGKPVTGSGAMSWQAAPLHVALHTPPPGQSSSWLWPGHGLGPFNVDVPVVSGKVTGTVPAGVPGGGQSEEVVNVWLPGALPTTTIPSVRHAWPCRGPLSQVPALPRSLPEQRGQSRFGEERKMSDSRCRFTAIAPVWTFAVPSVSFGLANRLERHTAMPWLRSGSGGPKVGPFT
ncbi:MAG: hypothetical protein E6J59_15115 [Deltaproteobacteria bacterium]|nr:MAG: hypothetical protein E6J59_15115 [Deltaproteobacteria bacterium]